MSSKSSRFYQTTLKQLSAISKQCERRGGVGALMFTNNCVYIGAVKERIGHDMHTVLGFMISPHLKMTQSLP